MDDGSWGFAYGRSKKMATLVRPFYVGKRSQDCQEGDQRENKGNGQKMVHTLTSGIKWESKLQTLSHYGFVCVCVYILYKHKYTCVYNLLDADLC